LIRAEFARAVLTALAKMRELRRLLYERGVVFYAAIAEVSQKIRAFVCLFEDNSELRLEFCARATASGRAIVRAHRVRGAAQLRRRLARLGCVGQPPDEFEHGESEEPCPFGEVTWWRHATACSNPPATTRTFDLPQRIRFAARCRESPIALSTYFSTFPLFNFFHF
jgi:hypothetical protein